MGFTDPALGISTDFDPAGFRSAIKFAMQLGAAPDVSLRPTFVFASTGRSYRKAGVTLAATSVRRDRDGKPLDPDVETIEIPGVRLQVDCAIEIVRADANEIPVGNFRPTKAVVTLLDEQYAQVKGCREMYYNGDRYLFGYEPDTVGMFDVGVSTMIFYCSQDN